MNADDFRNSPSGRLVRSLDGVHAFVPNPLPPRDLELGGLVAIIARATKALGELSGVGATLPNPYLLIRPFMRTEAVASSKIEGTVTTLPELFMLEAGSGAARNETKEVNNYTEALKYGLDRVKDLPISGRLLLEMHKVLMKDVDDARGAHIIPGEFKRDQNWIGARLIQNARFVPPPPAETLDCLADLERFVHEDDGHLPLIVKLALIHYQFEAIHPFPDGNGRIGRLLIPLILCHRNEISQPLLYMSSYFEDNYDEYIDLMLEVSRSGAWNPWIKFFLEGVEYSSARAIESARALVELHAKYRAAVATARSSGLLARLVDSLFDIPAVSIPYATHVLGVSYNSAKQNVAKLVALGILKPHTFPGDRDRTQWFFAEEIMRTYVVSGSQHQQK